MERCFTINADSALYKNYKEYINTSEINTAKIKAFISDNITKEEFSYARNSSTLRVSLTPTEATAFASQLKKDYTYANNRKIYTFKKNSAIGKAYDKLGIKNVIKPFPIDYAACNIYHARTRLFFNNDTLYCSIDSDELKSDTHIPTSTFTEISKSDFYKIVEDIEKND